MDYMYDLIIPICMVVIVLGIIGIAADIDNKRIKKEKQKTDEEKEKYNRLLKLENLKDMGAITEKEYELEKYKIKYDD